MKKIAIITTLVLSGVLASAAHAQYWRSTTPENPYPLDMYAQDDRPTGVQPTPIFTVLPTPLSGPSSNTYVPRPMPTIPVTYMTPTPVPEETTILLPAWNWRTYTIIGIVAAIIALVAFMIGRRSAR